MDSVPPGRTHFPFVRRWKHLRRLGHDTNWDKLEAYPAVPITSDRTLRVDGGLQDKRRSGSLRPHEFMKPVGKFQGLGRAIGIGSEMVAATGVGAAIGWWLDRLTGWSPWLLMVFFVLGSAAGFLAVYRGMQMGKGAEK